MQQQFPNAKVTGLAADFSKKEQLDNLLEQLNDIDILINNVGIFELKDFETISDEDWHHIFEVNVMSAVKLSRQLFSKMLAKNWEELFSSAVNRV